MDRSGTSVLAFMSDCLTKMGNEAVYIRLGKQHYLDALVLTSLLPRKHTRLSTQMKIYTASGATGKWGNVSDTCQHETYQSYT